MLRMIRWVVPLAFIAGMVSGAEPKGEEPQAPVEKPSIAPGVRMEPIAYPTPECTAPGAGVYLASERKVFEQELRSVYEWKSPVAHKIRPLVTEMEPEAVQQIAAELQAGAMNTPQDNVQRFYKALAARIPPFAKGFELARVGKYVEAAAEVAPLMEENPFAVGIKQRRRHDTLPPYIYNTVKFFYAECLGREGNISDCTIAYHIVYMNVPRSLTLAAPAMLRTASFYDVSNRGHFAIPLYQTLILRYGGLLSDAENFRLSNKAMKLSLSDDPYRRGERLADELVARLDRKETGALCQAEQKDIIAELQGMLIAIDEEDRPFLESSMAIVQGASEGKLRAGKIAEELILGEREGAGDDDWGKLRPRERQQLFEAFKEKYPERYTEMLELYYRRVSEVESQRAIETLGH